MIINDLRERGFVVCVRIVPNVLARLLKYFKTF